MKFTRAELDGFRGATIPDFVDDHVRLLLVGINPGLRSAAVGAPFGGGSNRFYPALFRAGITDRLIRASEGFVDEDAAHLHQRGVGILSLVAPATARADELTLEQLTDGAQRLSARVERIAPKVVAMLGITAYRAAFGRPLAVVGRQPETIANAELWVVPNPSGLNAHATLDSLAAAYAQVAVAAGIEIVPTVS